MSPLNPKTPANKTVAGKPIRRRGKRIICLIEDFQAHLDALSENAVQGKQGGAQC